MMGAAMVDDPAKNCPSDRLLSVIAIAKEDGLKGVAEADLLLRDYPRDPRLHFLRGSLLAGLEQYRDAHESMSIALAIAPGYAVARFQLGLLELTSANPNAAEATWRPLDNLASDDPLRVLAQGLRHLSVDRFEEALADLKTGISLNQDHPSISADMQLLIEAIEARASGSDQSGPVSVSHLLLQRYAGKTTLH
jgi:tetratricopeptide (TPR) repeat protein